MPVIFMLFSFCPVQGRDATLCGQIGNSSSQAPANGKRCPRNGQLPPCTTSTPATAEGRSITFVRYFEKLEPRNTRKLHIVFNPASAVLDIQCTLPAAAPRLLTLRRVCHSSAKNHQPPLRSGRRRTYTAARLNLQLLPARVPGTPAALLIIKDQSEIPAAGPDPQLPHPRPLPRKRAPALPASPFSPPAMAAAPGGPWSQAPCRKVC